MKEKMIYLAAGMMTAAIVFGWGGYSLGLRQAEVRSLLTDSRKIESRAEVETLRKARIRSFDVEEMKIEIGRVGSQLERYRIAQNNLEVWVSKDAVDALSWLVSQPASYRKRELIRLALQQYSETDGKGAAEWALENLEGAELNNSLIAVANEWARQNGSEAAQWFLALPDTPERDAAVENTMFVWAGNEPKAAIEFLSQRGEMEGLASVLRQASFAGWAKSDPEAAVTASLQISKQENDPEQFANTIANWATVDLEKSSSWLIENLEKGEQRTVAAAELGAIFAQQSPEDGVQFLSKLSEGEERELVGNAFAAEWASFGPEEAANWASTQQVIQLTEYTASEIAGNYLMKKPEEFTIWKNSLEVGVLRTVAEQVGQLPEQE
ncbi:MAG: hypothetical protein AB8D78_00355 [Akkermansiaceae bacterium]